jgi:ATP-dependent Clp protease adaptor protein ClpS
MSTRWDNDSGIVTEQKSGTQTKRPPLYKVLMHNDHYTTREFVVDVLRTVFHKSETEATQIMMHVHINGVGLAGVYPREIAETKIKTVQQLALEYEFPLLLTMEPET